MARWNTYDDEGAPPLPYGMTTIQEMIDAALEEHVAYIGDFDAYARDEAGPFLLHEMSPDEAERIVAVARTIDKHTALNTYEAFGIAIVWERG